MRNLETLPLKNIFLKSLIASVALSAGLGVLVILVGNFGAFEIKVLLTTLTISAASLCGLCCGAAIEVRGNRMFPLPGILSAIVAAVLVIIGLWGEAHSEVFWKSTATVTIFAVAFAHLSLLSLARLSARYAWAMLAAYALVLSLAFFLSGMLWGEWSEDLTFRLLGVLAVLDGAMTILTPIFHRLSQDDFKTAEEPTLAEIDREIARLESRLDELRMKKQRAERNQPGSR